VLLNAHVGETGGGPAIFIKVELKARSNVLLRQGEKGDQCGHREGMEVEPEADRFGIFSKDLSVVS
jgi:hypothetical protein